MYNEHSCNFQLSIPLEKSKILIKLPAGRVFILDKVRSTNQYIIDNISNIRIGDAFTTDHQTHGRGRRGKEWVTSFGQSICLSVYWKLPRVLSTVTELSLIISTTVASVLKKFGVSNIKIKWPNDLYINNYKLAGILIETIMKSREVTHVIIGIGINISICQQCLMLHFDMSRNWISLNDIGIIVDRNELIAVLVNVLRKKLKIFEYFTF